MTTIAPPEEIVLSLNFTGGLPSGRDFVPSLVMIGAYIITVPVLVWRIASRQSRDPILFRVALFALIRTASLTLRAAMARSPYSLNTLIAQLVLLSIGFLFLVEPLVALWKLSVDCAYPPGTGPAWVTYLYRTLHFILVAALTTGIIASSQISTSFDEGGMIVLNTLSLRQASYVLSLVVVTVTGLAIIYSHFRLSVPIFRTAYLSIVMIFLFITAMYRVSQSFSVYTYSDMRKPATFYFCQIFFEFLTYLALIIVSIPDAFPSLLLPTPARSRSISRYTEKPAPRQAARDIERPVTPTIRVRPRPLNHIARKPVPGSESSETVNTFATADSVISGRVSPLGTPMALIDLASPIKVDEQAIQERMMPLVPVHYENKTQEEAESGDMVRSMSV